MKLLFIIAAAAVMLLEHRRMSHVYRRRACLAVTLSRTVMLILAALYLMPPVHTVRTPRSDSLKIAVAADASASMDLKLGPSSTRRSLAEALLNSTDATGGLLSQGKTEYLIFSQAPQPMTTAPNGKMTLPAAPGNTCIGSVLSRLLQESRTGMPLSAVILMTDGRNTDGPNPLAVARDYAAEGIPVSTVCLPGNPDAADLSVKAVTQQLKAQKNTPFTLTADVLLRGGNRPNPITVDLLSDGTVLDKRTVTPVQGTPVPVSFTVQSPIPGFRSYMFRLNAPPDDIRMDNNTDFAAVDIETPPVFRILYLSYGMDWEWRFLRIACETHPQLSASAIIQTGKDHFFALLNDGGQDTPPKEVPSVTAFPSSPDAYADYDLIIAEARLFPHLDDAQRTAIRAFAEYKGGGLVIHGHDPNLPEDIQELLPAKTIRTMTAGSPVSLAVLTDLVFKKDTARAMQPSKGLWLSPPAVLDVIEVPRRSTRDIMRIGDLNGPAVAAVHAFGAGRVAFVGLHDTWRWALEPGPQRDAYHAFWHCIAIWLSETAKPAIKIDDEGHQLSAGTPHSFSASILDNDFRPAADARVTAEFTAPDGSRTTVDMQPSLETIGRYSADFIPQAAGEYRIGITAVFTSHEQRRQASFLAVSNSHETEDMTSDEIMLKDLARITHGRFYTPEEYLKEKANIPLSPNVPVMEEQQPLLPNWLSFTLFATAAALSWWIRRRLGLK